MLLKFSCVTVCWVNSTKSLVPASCSLFIISSAAEGFMRTNVNNSLRRSVVLKDETAMQSQHIAAHSSKSSGEEINCGLGQSKVRQVQLDRIATYCSPLFKIIRRRNKVRIRPKCSTRVQLDTLIRSEL